MTSYIHCDTKGDGLSHQFDYDSFQWFGSNKNEDMFSNPKDFQKSNGAPARCENDGLNPLFDLKRTSSDNERFKFSIEDHFKPEPSYKKDLCQFFFEDEPKYNQFKEPMKKPDQYSDYNQENTACNTKEFEKATKSHDQSSNDTNSGDSTQSMKSALFDGLSLFQDFIPVVEKQELPSLNHVVSMSIKDGDSSFSIKTNSSKINDCKLLTNFINIAEMDDLKALDKMLEGAKEDILAKLSKLPEGQ